MRTGNACEDSENYIFMHLMRVLRMGGILMSTTCLHDTQAHND